MAAGKNTGIQISLIICAVLMLIFGVVAYLEHKHASELQATLDTQSTELTNSKNASRNYLDNITAMKSLFGPSIETVGDAGSQDPNTVIGFVNSKMSELAENSAQPTVVETLTRMREVINGKEREISDLQNSENKINGEKVLLAEVYNTKAETYNENYQKSEQDKLALIKEKEETVDGIQVKLTEERAKNSDMQIAYEKLQEESNNIRDDLNDQISKLTKTNEVLTKEINDLTEQSFDIPDGNIVGVSFDSNTVSINLGSEDNLKPGLNFSVYEKNIATVGGRTSEIKASIEVIQIIGGHQAIAKITSEGRYPGDYSRPIARGDAIYSPLWRSGVQEIFAMLGTFDLDGDKTDDRNILLNLILNGGGDVRAQVTPDGERSGDEITSQFKYLVLGDIGDPSKEPDEQARQMIQKVHSHTNDMLKEAQQSGVRVITMNDFLSYMGYKPQRRLWRPGENIPWVMTTRRDGGRSRSDNISGGQVSGAYKRSDRDVSSPR